MNSLNHAIRNCCRENRLSLFVLLVKATTKIDGEGYVVGELFLSTLSCVFSNLGCLLLVSANTMNDEGMLDYW